MSMWSFGSLNRASWGILLHFEVYLRHMILSLYQEYGTSLLGIFGPLQ